MITLKIGRHSYTITEIDIFMDNGACVQLLSQSKETPDLGRRPNPVLSKRAIKEMSALTRVQHNHSHGKRVTIFNLISDKLIS
jgi:hypothetical protein